MYTNFLPSADAQSHEFTTTGKNPTRFTTRMRYFDVAAVAFFQFIFACYEVASIVTLISMKEKREKAVQWNFNKTKGQVGSISAALWQNTFAITRFRCSFPFIFAITGVRNIVRYPEDFVI